MRNNKILVLTDSFKGALSSLEAGTAIANGIQKALSETDSTYDVLVFPCADGGEGTAEALCAALQGTLRTVESVDLFGHPILAEYADLPGDIPTAVLDMATTCGIVLAKQYGLNPMNASTFGVGLMIKKLAEAGYRRILVGMGGSGTNDGGIGALTALGAVFRDENGKLLDCSLGGKMLSQIASVNLDAVHQGFANIRLELLYDAAVPLTGDSGATRMFGEQKGASAAELDILESGMVQYAACADAVSGTALSQIGGCGAAGGLGFGLTLAGGVLCHGASYVLETLGIPTLFRNTALVFTGEGKTDLQTARGKLPHTVAQYASKAGVPCIDICGQACPPAQLYADGMTAIVSILSGCMTLEESIAQTAALLETTAYNLTRLWLAAN